MSPLLDQFVEWFDRENVAEVFDSFIATHACAFEGASSSPDAEQKLEWGELYQKYTKLFDEKLAAFLTEANTTSDEFLNVARHAEGVHEAYLQIFLAHAEYDVFVALMVEKANADK